MPDFARHKTDYPGVVYIIGKRARKRTTPDQKIKAGSEKIFYVIYRKDGRLIEERVGRQFQDAMTPARAATIRAERMEGKDLPNVERRKREKEERNKKVWTMTALWEEYKANNPIKGMATDKSRFEAHIKPLLGDKEPREILPLDVDRLRVKMSKTYKPATVKNTLELLRRIILFGVKKNLIPSPSFKIKLPKVSNLKTEDLTQEQIARLLRAIEENPENPAGPIMKLTLLTGMRRGEIFGLKWGDIDFERGFIHIRDSKGAQEQTIPLNDDVRALLRAQRKPESPYLFPGRKGKERVDLKKSLAKLKTAAGLPEDFRPLHGLRHVFASTLASSGQVDLYTLQKMLTHKSPAMTQRYAHLRDEALKKAANLAGTLLMENANNEKNIKNISKKQKA